jgi:ubiquinone/menaquinone biosynthesis C-methylase UbiE
VIGAPDGGVTAGYGCGDITIDLQPSRCACSMQADITQRLPFEDNSVVTYTSCVLEYVHDADAALREIMRISGHPAQAFFCGVEPFTLTAYLYPGARRTLPSHLR